jgi:hypothetical protein
MIYLTPGVTQSTWLSLKEDMAYGSTSSVIFTFTNDMTGEVITFTPVDLQPTNKWSRYDLYVGTPQSLPETLDMRPGMWSYEIVSDNTTLETGKVVVENTKTWMTRTTPAKNTAVFKR